MKDPLLQGRIRRRDFFRASGAAAIVGTALAGCAPGKAHPTVANNVITLVFQPDGTLNTSTNASLLNKLYTEALDPFIKANKGLNVTVTPSLWGDNVAAIAGGAGSDIISDNYPPPYWQDGLLLNLDPYIKEDGIDTTAWSQGIMEVFTQPFGLMMLPAYTSPFVYCVNLSDFAAAGLPYPDPDWTWTEFTTVAQQITQYIQPKRGVELDFFSNGPEEANYVFKGFGTSLCNAAGTKSNLGTSAAIQAGEWLYNDMLWKDIAYFRSQAGFGTQADGFQLVAMYETWDGGVFFQAQTYQDTFDWDYLPFPVFPSGQRATMGTDDFYGINIQTKHPDQAWLLMKYLTYQTTWQKDLMKIGMLQPALLSLWPTWISAVGSVAPFMANKQLQWFEDAAVKGYAYPQQYYAYDDKQVQAVAAPYFESLYSNTTTVAAAFTEAAAQIDSFIASIEVQAAAEENAIIAANSGSPTQPYAAPSLTGAGSPSTAAGSLITSSNGTYTLTGVGWDIWGLADGCTFAAVADTAYSGSWTAQLTSIANLSETPSISSEARIGLMARGDLSSVAPMVIVSVNLAGGVTTEIRSSATAAAAQTLGNSIKPPSKTGYIAPQYLLKNYQTTQSNYLLHPVWFRLDRNGLDWTLYTSLTGSTWNQVGDPIHITMGGVWVGMFATAGNVVTGGQGQIQAVFNHASFTPTQMVQLTGTS